MTDTEPPAPAVPAAPDTYQGALKALFLAEKLAQRRLRTMDALGEENRRLVHQRDVLHAQLIEARKAHHRLEQALTGLRDAVWATPKEAPPDTGRPDEDRDEGAGEGDARGRARSTRAAGSTVSPAPLPLQSLLPDGAYVAGGDTIGSPGP